MVCTSSLDALVSVVLTARVTTSTLDTVGAHVGDTLSLSFNVDPTWVHREIVGQGVVEDGIGPFGVCDEHFLLSFSSGLQANLKMPEPAAAGIAAPPVDKDAPSSVSLGLPKDAPPFWFSMMKARPVLDGVFVSTMADKASAGVPLSVQGGSPSAAHTLFTDVRFDRHTFQSVKVLDSFGTYDAKALRPVESTISVTRDWDSNVVLTAEFESLTISRDTSAIAHKALGARKTLAAAAKARPAFFAPTASDAAAKAKAGFPEKCCWCDETTPEEAKTITGPTDGAAYHLIFSDEFNTAGRTFRNGEDSKWTALEVGDTANQGVAFYLPEQATIAQDTEATGEGSTAPSTLLITTDNSPHVGDSPTGEHGIAMPCKSAMLQSWNKFCFTSGIVEFRARQPRGGGYWPALWLFGNLGRAVYQNSNTGLWPWSYDRCDTDLELPQTDPPQRISACDDHDLASEGLHGFQGRGATELDLLEGAVTNDGQVRDRRSN